MMLTHNPMFTGSLVPATLWGLCFQPCDSGAYAVLAELRRCGLTDSETCLKSLTLSLGHTVSAGRAGVPPGKRPLRGL